MRVLKLDTKQIVEVSENEAFAMILNDVAVEASETAALDRSHNTAVKPRPVPKSPSRERRGRKKR